MKWPTARRIARRMPGPVGTLAELPKPVWVLVVAVAFGGVVGAVVAHTVLAVWVYRDARAREMTRPDRWALAALLGGVFVFGPYLVVRRIAEAVESDHPLARLFRWIRRTTER